MDVVDAARLHAIALLSSTVRSERLFAAARPFVWDEVVGILRQLQPDNTLIPDAPMKEHPTLGQVEGVRRAEKLLLMYFGQSSWTPMDISIQNGVLGIS